MKFSNGCWLNREGVECFSPAQIYFSDIRENEATLCVPTSRIWNRGCTLGGVVLTMKISTPWPDVFHVRVRPRRSSMPAGSSTSSR